MGYQPKLKLSDAPGCIGSPVIRAQNYKSCAPENCMFRGVCGQLAKHRGAQIKKDLNVASLKNTGGALDEKPSTKNAKPTVDKRALTQRGAALVSSIKRLNMDRESILSIITSEGEIEDRLEGITPEYLAVTLRALWDTPNLEKRQLKARFEHDIGMSALTAQSHVSIITNAFTHLQIVKDVSGVFIISGD